MAHAGDPHDEPAHGLIWARGAAGGGGDDNPRLVSVARVTVYHATDCGLCARALEVVGELRDDLGFELDVVDIGGDPALEARYRELLPAVEVDGELAFTYFLDADALRERLGR